MFRSSPERSSRALARSPHRVVFAALAAAAAAVAPVAWSGASPAGALTANPSVTYTTTGTEQTYTVPPGVAAVRIVAIGGHGGSSLGSTSSPTPGGAGATVSADVPVAAGTTLFVEVGGNGGDGGSPQSGATLPTQGYNGGGLAGLGDQNLAFGGAGGGASDVRTCSAAASTCTTSASTLGSRLVVAAGGGGAGTGLLPSFSGGAGGAGTQAGGTGGGNPFSPPDGGGAGTETAGGAAGQPQGMAGSFGHGGDSVTAPNAPLNGGGGGGGGWFGGGSGGNAYLTDAAAGGGGGGSDWIVGSATNVSTGTDSTGTPSITITPLYEAPGATTLPASAITTTGATLNGVVNPNGADTTYFFEYEDDKLYQAQLGAPDPFAAGLRTPSDSAGAGRSDAPVSMQVSGLAASTKYHFRIVATNLVGTTSFGVGQVFTTAPK